ncbi:MAG: epoxyqueuosine reductase QueH [Oscillospiraceae bacterium]|nr:epoxyqueuosine reductase QueH [Oscillospiraceae bacterium]
MKKKLLLHACCAPCLMGTLPMIGGGFEISCFWYGANIHPYTEYRARLEALADYAGKNSINLIVRDYYGLAEFVRNTINDLKNRCAYCYRLRLEETAKQAKEGGFDAFSTTLLVSPYQNREKIMEIGEQCSESHGINFFCGDFRANFWQGQKTARESGVYMQKYCGCIFSEEERFLSKSY